MSVGTELAGKNGHFLIAQLRVFGGHVGDRAVMLAELAANADLMQGGRIPGTGERLGEDHRAIGDVRCRIEPVAVRRNHGFGAAAGELVDGVRADRLGEVVEGLHRELVVGVG